MGDSPEMTIEFLRARLLSERSVSRSTRQRADQLAKRVVELEDQLRIVSIQRKKAEKAAAEVLAILEREGIGEFSEVIDSSSDLEESAGDPQGSSGIGKEDGSSAASRVNKSEVDDGYSATECDASPSQGHGKSLSWKRESDRLNPPEKGRLYQTRHRSKSKSFVHRSESSQKTYLGKSCRKIKRRDNGSASEIGDGCSVENNNEKCASQDALETHFDDNMDTSLRAEQPETDGALENKQSNISTLSSCVLEEHDEYLNSKVYVNGNDKDDMEQALEKQAKLIDQFQAEENAQREWEEKFNNNSCHIREPSRTLAAGFEERIKPDKHVDLSDNGMCYDNTEERRENGSFLKQTSRDEKYGSGSKSFTNGHGERSSTICNESLAPGVGASCSASTPHPNLEGLTNHVANDAINRIHPRKIQGEGSLKENSKIITNGNRDQMLGFDGFIPNPGIDLVSSALSAPSSSMSKAQESQNPTVKPPSRFQGDGLVGVLDALQDAKVYLRKEIDRMSEPTHSSRFSVTELQAMSTEPSNFAGIPTSTSGLFRLPTDALPNSDVLKSDHRYFNPRLLEMSSIDRDLAFAPSSRYDQLLSSEYKSRYPVRDWELDSRYNQGTRTFSHNGNMISHLRADSTIPGSYSLYDTTSSESQYRYPARDWEVDSRLNAGTRAFSSHDRRISHFRADSVVPGSYSGYQIQRSYDNPQAQLISRDRHSNRKTR